MPNEPRLRRVHSESEMEQIIDDYVTQGYEIVNRGERSSLVRKKQLGTGLGHFLTFLLTVWWTFGLGNLSYAMVARYMLSEKVLVRLVDE